MCLHFLLLYNDHVGKSALLLRQQAIWKVLKGETSPIVSRILEVKNVASYLPVEKLVGTLSNMTFYSMNLWSHCCRGITSLKYRPLSLWNVNGGSKQWFHDCTQSKVWTGVHFFQIQRKRNTKSPVTIVFDSVVYLSKLKCSIVGRISLSAVLRVEIRRAFRATVWFSGPTEVNLRGRASLLDLLSTMWIFDNSCNRRVDLWSQMNSPLRWHREHDNDRTFSWSIFRECW